MGFIHQKLTLTIIVLIILASITILSLSNTKLFSKAQESTDKYKVAQQDEQNTLNEYNSYISNNSREDVAIDKSEYKKKLVKLLNENGIETSENENFDSLLSKLDLKLKDKKYNKTLVYDMPSITSPYNSTSITIDCTSYKGYENFTNDNFALLVTGLYANGSVSNSYYTFNETDFSYDNKTGQLKINRWTGVGGRTDLRYTAKVYLFN